MWPALISLGVLALVLLLVGWLVRTARSEAVSEHKVEEAKANAEATIKATGELVRHVERGDTAKSLRDGVF